MNLNQNHLSRVLLLVAMTCPIISRGDDAANKPASNPYLESLRRSKEAHLKTMETSNKRENVNVFDPDQIIVRRYDEAIANAEKIIASGGTYGRKEVAAAQKAISEESKKVGERFLEKATQRAKDARQKSNEMYERKVAEANKRFDATTSQSNATFQRKTAEANLTFRLKTNAGKLGMVIWNLPSKTVLHERSTVNVRIDLLKNDRVVWTNKLVRLNRRADNSPIRFPNVIFDKVKVETTRWTGNGSGLAEVEVYAGNENIALGRPCEVSSIETVPVHLDDRDALTDGIVSPTEIGDGYWIPEEETKATVTIDLLGDPNKEVLAAAKERAARAPIR